MLLAPKCSSAHKLDATPIVKQKDVYVLQGTTSDGDNSFVVALPPFNASEAFADADRKELERFYEDAKNSNSSDSDLLSPPTPPFRYC